MCFLFSLLFCFLTSTHATHAHAPYARMCTRYSTKYNIISIITTPVYTFVTRDEEGSKRRDEDEWLNTVDMMCHGSSRSKKCLALKHRNQAICHKEAPKNMKGV